MAYAAHVRAGALELLMRSNRCGVARRMMHMVLCALAWRMAHIVSIRCRLHPASSGSNPQHHCLLVLARFCRRRLSWAVLQAWREHAWFAPKYRHAEEFWAQRRQRGGRKRMLPGLLARAFLAAAQWLYSPLPCMDP